MKISLVEIQDAQLAALSAIRDEVATLFEVHGKDDSITQTLRMLFRYLSERSQAVSFLTSHGYAWDAEIVLRAFYESAAKIAFICLAKPSEKDGLMDEFWNQLGAVSDKRTSRKAKAVQSVWNKNEDNNRVFQYLQQPEGMRTSSKSKNELRKIEQKWSFAEIIDVIEKAFPGALSLLHMYGIASHLVHADHGALELMIDRGQRETQELTLLRASHACRIFSDQANLFYWCAESLRLHFGGKFSDGKKLRDSLSAYGKLAEPLNERFNRTQDQFYARAIHRK